MTGGIRSLVQLTVLIAVAELPQPSEAVKVLTCEKVQPLEVAAPSEKLQISYSTASISSGSRTKSSIDCGRSWITSKSTEAWYNNKWSVT